MMLTAIALFLMITGDTSFSAISQALVKNRGNDLAKMATGLFICGMFIQGGLVPFHGWLPAAYTSASAPVSVLLAGITTKVSGIYVLVRFTLHVFGADPSVSAVLLAVGIISVITGAVAALMQTDMKWLLAYSSISQVGYIILGLGCGSVLGIAGAVFHLFNHAIFKSLLFVNAAAVEKQAGTTDMSKLGGLGPRMPVTNITSLLGILSTAGVPPLSGFWSKLIIIIALWQSGNHFLAVLAIAFSVLTLAYLLSMERKVFFGKLSDACANVVEGDINIVIPSVVLGAITVAVGVILPFILKDLFMTLEQIQKFISG
jgi:multicomponent Na+:H+ antiporter subunit D